MISGRWRFIVQIKKSSIFCDITYLYALAKVIESDARLVRNRFQLMDHEMKPHHFMVFITLSTNDFNYYSFIMSELSWLL